MSRTACLATVALGLLLVSPDASADPLTDIEAYAPELSGEPKFRMAKACHDTERDVFGVIAVWWVHFGIDFDVVRYLRVEGDAGSPDYGAVIDDIPLTAEFRVDHVDCASDGQNIYVTYDRRYVDPRWYRIDGTSVSPPYEVTPPPCDGRKGAGGWDLHTHLPRIAFADTPEGPRVAVAVAVKDWISDVGSSSACAEQFDANTGTPLVSTVFWAESGISREYDLEWNGDRFLWAVEYDDDGVGPPEVNFHESITFDLGGAERSRHRIETFIPATSVQPNQMVWSADHETMFWQTARRTYWLDAEGANMGAINNVVGDRVAACDYRGSNGHVATSFGQGFVYLGSFPWGMFFSATIRGWFDPSPGPAAAVNTGSTAFYPEACSSSDDEVLLVSRPQGGNDAFIYTGMESID